MFAEDWLIDRREHLGNRLLYNAIEHSWNSERAKLRLTPVLGNIHTTNWRWGVAPILQLAAHTFPVFANEIGELPRFHPIDARRSSIGPHLLPSQSQVLGTQDIFPVSLHGSSLSPPAHHVPFPLHLSASSCGMVLRVGSPSLVRTFAGLSPPAILPCSCALRLDSPALTSSADFCPGHRTCLHARRSPLSQGRKAGQISPGKNETLRRPSVPFTPGLNEGTSLCCRAIPKPWRRWVPALPTPSAYDGLLVHRLAAFS